MAQTPAELEDAVVRRILAVALEPHHAAQVDGLPVVFLSALAEELAAERSHVPPSDASQPTPPLRLGRDDLDRVMVARLIEQPPDSYPLPPAQYLMAAFARASSELRGQHARLEPAALAALQAAAAGVKELALSYLGLVLTGTGVVPEPEAAAARGALQLLDAMDARDSGAQPGVTALPPGLLEELSARLEGEALQALLAPVACTLARRAVACSPLGDYQPPLAAVKHLVGIDPAAAALVAIPQFLPDLVRHTGRAAQLPGSCWLGALFSISAIPDALVPAQPSVSEHCFGNVQSRRQGDLVRSMSSLRMAAKHITGELHAIIKSLLGKATRERCLDWLGGVIEANGERAKMQANLAVACSDGFFVNLDLVLLRLCAPFLDPSSPLFWKRVHVSYLAAPSARISVKEDSKLAATSEEEAAWLERTRAGSAAGTSTSGNGGSGAGGEGSGGSYAFVCEAFFMTFKALHLGAAKLISSMEDETRRIHYLSSDERELDATLTRGAGHHEPLLRRQLAEVRAALDASRVQQLAVETALGDADVVADLLAFYRLAAAWLLGVARTPPGGGAAPGPGVPPSLPLPEAVPPEFATLPEWMVEDLADVLLYVTRLHPQLLSGVRLDDMMLFLVVFIGSPRYIRSPYLRSKLSEVVHAWLPSSLEHSASARRGPQPRGGAAASLSYLFEAHPLVVQHLVPSLLSLYSDIEYTDRSNQFYMKFTLRSYIGDVLAYCWQLPAHCAVWAAFAEQEGGRGPYLRFANMVINDSIYLLDEALKKLKELREFETLQASARWDELPAREQQERAQAAAQAGQHLKVLLTHASSTINTLAYSTSRVVAPFLLPEMVERLAAMLNYFLLYLTGPQRKELKVRDPEKYNFNPKALLAQICTIYLHAAAADRAGAFAAAVAADARSYRPAMFSEAALVLRQFALMPESDIGSLEALGACVVAAASAGAADEEMLGEVPDEFLDPIQYTLMHDPVLLPSSGAVMDRATIMRHLLSDQRDPINRSPLTAEMLQPADELRGRIRAWLAEQRRTAR